MKFKIDFEGKKNIGNPTYDVEGYSFDYHSHTSYDSILRVRYYLELPFSYFDRKIGYVAGLCGYQVWKSMIMNPPEYNEGSLIVEEQSIKEPLEDKIILSVYDLEETKDWSVYLNPKTGWVCIGNPETQNIEVVEFATDTIAVLNNGELKALWVKPKNLLEDFKKKDIKIGK